MHARDEFQRREWLDHIIVCTGHEAAHALAFFDARGEEA
jgi:hypothetical protein